MILLSESGFNFRSPLEFRAGKKLLSDSDRDRADLRESERANERNTYLGLEVGTNS